VSCALCSDCSLAPFQRDGHVQQGRREGTTSARCADQALWRGLAGSAAIVVRTLAFLVMPRMPSAVVGQTPDAKDVEIAVLRHQPAVLLR
jgi:hypothetical protein